MIYFLGILTGMLILIVIYGSYIVYTYHKEYKSKSSILIKKENVIETLNHFGVNDKMLEELQMIRNELNEARIAKDLLLIGFAINKLDTFMFRNQEHLKTIDLLLK